MACRTAHPCRRSALAVAFICFICGAGALAASVLLPLPAAAAPEPKVIPRWRSGPDPAPLTTSEQLELFVSHGRDGVKVLRIEKRQLPRPTLISPRFRGRFEVRLFSATGLLRDVIRFDFPLTAASGDPSVAGDDRLGRELGRGVTARTSVKIPFDASISSVVIHDTAVASQLRIDLTRFQPPRSLPPSVTTLPRPSSQPSATPASPKAGAKKSKARSAKKR